MNSVFEIYGTKKCERHRKYLYGLKNKNKTKNISKDRKALKKKKYLFLEVIQQLN